MSTFEQLIDGAIAAVSDFFASNPELTKTLLAVLVAGFLLYVFVYDDDDYRATDRYHGYGERGRYDDSLDGPGGRRYRRGYDDAYRERYGRDDW